MQGSAGILSMLLLLLLLQPPAASDPAHWQPLPRACMACVLSSRRTYMQKNNWGVIPDAILSSES